jgi:hypothetical protein
MRRAILFVFALLLCGTVAAAEAPVSATIETTLTTAGEQIRQFAFDGDPDTYFASKKDVESTDHFTLVFTKPVSVKSVEVTTGRPKGGDQLDAGTLEVSVDGKTFEAIGTFSKGVARGKPDGKQAIRAVRIRTSKDLKHPLAIREIAIESEPAVTVFKYPVEFIIDVSDAPEMKEWADKAARICERQYRMINEELKVDGYRPPRVVTMTLKKNYNGVAAAGGGRITGSVRYFKSHPDDVGAMVHETVHIVQQYRSRNNPGWLVEGVADYVRFFKYEPGTLRSLRPDQAKYNGSYRVTAAFLAFVVDKHDKELIRKLNALMREGKYREESFKDITGKTVKELEEEWQASLRK